MIVKVVEAFAGCKHVAVEEMRLMADGRPCRTNHVSASPESFLYRVFLAHQHNLGTINNQTADWLRNMVNRLTY